ncbi:MAG: phosphoribosylanthranilate isomerase [Dehalococcoidia bacterium]|nr:phosphoribosylanthranilate isomerase [Dehalococcoidia bacterium]
MTLVKICGLRDAETARATKEAGADFIGLNFARSKRRVTPQEAFEILAVLREGRDPTTPVDFDAPACGEVRGLSWFGAWSEAIEQSVAAHRPLVVGIFADQPLEEVNDIADAAGLDLVQLSGGEDEAFIRGVRRPVVRALHVAEDTDADALLDTAQEVPTAAILLDTASKQARGGTGETFDWDIAAGAAERLPLFLAGGLHPGNVAEAVERVVPWAVDVASGVETDGKKDIDKIRAFIRAAKGVRVER